MIEVLLRQINGWVYTWFGAEGLVVYQQHPIAYALALAGPVLVLCSVAVYLGRRGAGSLRRRVAQTQRGFARTLALTRYRAGRRSLALTREIRRCSQRLRRIAAQVVGDKDERRELLRLLDSFLATDLEQALEQMYSWAALGDGDRMKALQRQLERRTRRWSAAQEEAARRRLEERVAQTRQQLAVALQARADRVHLLEGLEEAAAAIRTLEAELVALGSARSQALPLFQAQLADLSEGFRHRREVYLEFQARPG